MTDSVIEGVYLGQAFDLEETYGRYFAPHADRVRLRRPEDIDNPSDITFALTWLPAPDAFDAFPNVKVACSIAAGVDSIIHCPSLPAHVDVTRVRDDDQADLMAGFAAWHVIWHHRNMGLHIKRQAESTWERQTFENTVSPRDYTVGLLGYGLMGKAIARAITGMGFKVVAAVRSEPKDQDLPGVSFEIGADSIQKTAARSQLLINVLPLTDATKGILAKPLFDLMPKGARLVQLGRGAHLVDADLDDALNSGQIGGASLDVFHVEPLPSDHPWWKDERIVITPHQASDSSKAVMARQVVQAACDVAAGKRPANVVDRTKGY